MAKLLVFILMAPCVALLLILVLSDKPDPNLHSYGCLTDSEARQFRAQAAGPSGPSRPGHRVTPQEEDAFVAQMASAVCRLRATGSR
jgi:hypothetical protein